MSGKKKPVILLRTFGCQMNKRDSEIVRGMLEEKGYRFIDDEKEAEIIIFNTCSVREHAEQKAVSIMGALTRKKARKHKVYGIIGCVAQHKKEGLFKSLPNLDFIAGPSDIYRIPELICASVKNKEFKKTKAAAVDAQTRPLDYSDPVYRDSKTHAYVNIMYGCDNYCSYCIVPYVRGHEVSRPVRDIVKEIEQVVRGGILHVTLLGQNVNSYKELTAGLVDFVGLLRQVHGIPGLKKISFITSHPKDATKKLFEAMRDLPKVDKHLHLPIQSGSNRILTLMNRGYTAEKFLGLIADYRALVPGGTVSTDVVVGFPTETEEEFKATEKSLETVRFDSAYILKYSPRPPAKSAEFPDDVPKAEKERRHGILLELQKNIYKELHRPSSLSKRR
ncbi:MAG: tRNA (N6-isopentenyl adenosine(37)-C2)-methylthiotransferase MiaB [Candidatus Omnitrophica bacterium]|nr:tRNA (N6-isopentenyl adenosine(37)-C2)-methylthiotransferase MiaB [Candidatus Omnitrophota bacterium]